MYYSIPHSEVILRSGCLWGASNRNSFGMSVLEVNGVIGQRSNIKFHQSCDGEFQEANN